MRKELGKIENIRFGIGGYQEAMIGVHITLSGEGWGVCTNDSAWDANMIKHTEHCKWTESDRDKQYSDIVRKISDLLKAAKVDSLDKLKGKPVEATFDGMTLSSWRILTEVL